MKTIKIELNIDEANLIIEALGQMPFSKVYKLIEKIHLQANKQLKTTDIDKNMEQQSELKA